MKTDSQSLNWLENPRKEQVVEIINKKGGAFTYFCMDKWKNDTKYKVTKENATHIEANWQRYFDRHLKFELPTPHRRDSWNEATKKNR